NLDTSSSVGKENNYRKQMKTMQVLDSLNDNNLISGYFKKWYHPTKNKYEFYDISKDPFELKNLFYDSNYTYEIKEHMSQLDKWMNSSEFCNMSESEMLKQMFQEDYKPRKLNPPTIENTDKGLVIKSKDSGTSIGYRKKGDKKWNIYTMDSKVSHVNKTEIIMFKPGYELLYKLID
ncbi:MAG: hypothetical protein VX145_06270, partial [Bacteroidota bacterium]|nr:hypothetical protein [Bacteroidota bacterium]